MTLQLQHLEVDENERARTIAVRYRSAEALGNGDDHKPGVVWLGGYRSDMIGTKAEKLDEWAQKQGRSCCRHDYSGHGESGGDFMEGTISRWLEESLAVFDAFTKGPQVLVGSSMGAWVALRMVQELNKRGEKDRLAGLLLLAPAPDFTHELMLPQLSDEHRRQLNERGYMEEQSQYSDDPNIFTKALFDDGEKSRVMTGLIETGCDVHIIQGMQDDDVPYNHALKLLEFLPNENVTMTLVKDGDHRLSREQDIAAMLQAVENFA